ncbi:hypothetical protein [Sphingopyxis sp. 22461]|uniref:hypothetical protein n=1 Tax=Sphingopyxis sp. 22461 TaxID=3453923 RepID=UPI003F87D05D
MMAAITETTLIEALRLSIRGQIEEIIEEEGTAAAERVRKRVADVAPSMATRLLTHFDIARDERRIVIEIRKIMDDNGGSKNG